MREDSTMIVVRNNTRQKIKTLASFEGQTIPEWMEWMVNRAYDATLINQGREAKKKHAKKTK